MRRGSSVIVLTRRSGVGPVIACKASSEERACPVKLSPIAYIGRLRVDRCDRDVVPHAPMEAAANDLTLPGPLDG